MNLTCISQKYCEFLKEIQLYFNQSQNSIHKARNEIKIVNFQDESLVLKSFKVPNLLNKIVYTFFKTSKAKKSYENSLKIGDFAPKPIGVVEFKRFGLLDASYFVSEHFDYDFTIREVLKDSSFEDREKIFQTFAQFTFLLHERDILHLDYSPGNILIKKEGEAYIFKIVDINRMEFKPLSHEQRLQNFSKLWAKDEDLAAIAKEYSKLSKSSEESCIKTALKFSHAHKRKINIKKRLRGKKVVD